MSYQVLQRTTGRREVRRINLPIVEWRGDWERLGVIGEPHFCGETLFVFGYGYESVVGDGILVSFDYGKTFQAAVYPAMPFASPVRRTLAGKYVAYSTASKSFYLSDDAISWSALALPGDFDATVEWHVWGNRIVLMCSTSGLEMTNQTGEDFVYYSVNGDSWVNTTSTWPGAPYISGGFEGDYCHFGNGEVIAMIQPGWEWSSSYPTIWEQRPFQFWKSNNYGATWTRKYPSDESESFTFFNQRGSRNYRRRERYSGMYRTGNNSVAFTVENSWHVWQQGGSPALQVFSSSDRGETWREVSIGGLDSAPHVGIFHAGENVLFLQGNIISSIQSGSGYISRNGGATWSGMPPMVGFTSPLGPGIGQFASLKTGKDVWMCPQGFFANPDKLCRSIDGGGTWGLFAGDTELFLQGVPLCEHYFEKMDLGGGYLFVNVLASNGDASDLKLGVFRTKVAHASAIPGPANNPYTPTIPDDPDDPDNPDAPEIPDQRVSGILWLWDWDWSNVEFWAEGMYPYGSGTPWGMADPFWPGNNSIPLPEGYEGEEDWSWLWSWKWGSWPMPWQGYLSNPWDGWEP